MSEGQHEFRRALRFRFLTRFYDPLFRWGLREARVKGDLVGQATLLAGQSVLDVGCGTGTLALAIRAACPAAHVVGLDADPEILLIAAGKAGKAAAPIRFDRGLATALPYPDGAFDHVFSSLMLHHLTGGERREALRQVVRVLKPGGWFHLVDWDRPQAWPLHLPFFLVRALDGFDRTEDSARGRLSALLGEAGFGEVEHLGRYATVGGTLGRYRATRS